ncbi:MAG TPA: hypothetical protein VMR62_39910 [Bryobacteraceae bacterium]|jgi:hypothetical protein|nr:hypothetical protein [Bryobacteraceae bacterium]
MTAPRTGERRQFRALVRLFAYRFFDADIISVRGDLSSLLSQFAALLAALSLVLVMVTGPKYAGLYQHPTASQLAAAAWADQEFLISTSMAIVGVFTLLLWDALFPDRRDCMILGTLPVRVRTVFRAKVAALGTALGLTVVTVNAFTGLVCPFLIVRGAGMWDAVRSFVAYWLVISLASVFVFLLLLGLQGVALHLLPHGRFLRWSSWIQTVAFFAVLTLYFLTPPLANPQALADPRNRLWYALIPSYWFFGLFQFLTGSTSAVMHALARRALIACGSAVLVAGVSYALAYARQMRRTVEQSGIAPGASRRWSGVSPWRAIARLIAQRAPERAILVFIGRAVARSRQHRLLLAIYTGMGMAYVFSQVAYVLYRSRATDFGAMEGRIQTAMGIPFIMLFFLVAGLRVSFSIPVEVRANWIFRLTDTFSRGAYLSATRKAMLCLALAPVVAMAAPIYLYLWPWPRALGHIVFVTALGLLLIELALTGFVKVPFTCSYLPGKANLKIMFGVYWGLLMIVPELVTDAELAGLRSPARYAWLLGVTLLAWLAAAQRGRGARARVPTLSFEEHPEPAVVGLGLASRT